ncbi:MAG: hypothetical protein IT256_06035 [Chitinophagaceae bacterium]|nr:hypothetical protein [Chitinophagaceae bacterium]
MKKSCLSIWKTTLCKSLGLAAVLLLLNYAAIAQSKATQKAAQRYEVDAKRMGVDASSEDALPRSREFKRIDSSYYVGWFFEGMYKLNHAADYLGYKNAIAPLEKALHLLERDYAKELKTHSNDLQIYYPVYRFQLDYSRIGGALRECYANTEQPEKVVKLMRRALRWKLQRELYLDAYNYLAWTTHRYRFYTQKEYSFLGNSIVANEALAMRYLDTALVQIQRNKKYNNGLFQPGYEVADIMGVYHYKCILYSYALNIDSAEKYYGLMRRNNVLPHNNYANFKTVCGQFKEAEKEYQIASGQESGDKRLQEWAYYTSILQIGKGQLKEATELSENMIKGFGSSPGFGWYNIAMARALSYSGQVKASEKASEKAANFKELHIGTTLGQSHYDFSLQLLKLIQKEQQITQQKFEHKNWWYNPQVLAKMTTLTAQRIMHQYMMVNQFAQNPERDRVVYKLFSTESTVGWDEVWYLIKDFSTAFFVKRFEQELKENKRKPIDKYFRLFVAKLKTKQGKFTESKALLNEILTDPTIDAEYERLLVARCYEALAACATEEKDLASAQKWTYLMFKTYPQLLPFSSQKLKLQLRINGSEPNAIEALKKCNFDFENTDKYTASATIKFLKNGKKKIVSCMVQDVQGKVLIPEQQYAYSTPEKAGIAIAYSICGISNDASNL